MRENEKIIELISASSFVFEEQLLIEIGQFGTLKTVDKETELIGYHQEIQAIPFIIEGSLKVFREDTNGNELLLYYIEPGETCAMSLSCTISKKISGLRVVAEEDSIMLMIPLNKMEDWMNSYPSWRSFIVESYYTRFNELLTSIDELAFKSLDQRLWRYLVDKVKINNSLEIYISHKSIAEELNSSRVVISRLLKVLENNNQLVLHRNKIELKHF